MFSKKVRRRLRIGAFVALSIGGLAYALRWPLLERPLVAAARKKTVQAVGADVRIGTLSGSIVSAVRARNIQLLPRADSPLRSGRVESLEARYGFLGLSGLHVTVRGLRIELAPSKKAPPPLQESIREAVSSLEQVKMPAEVVIENATIITAEGSEVFIDRARWAGDEGIVQVRAQALGQVEVALRRGADHELRIRGTASQGPVSEVSFDIDGGSGPDHPARLRATAGQEILQWDGKVGFAPDGQPSLVEGKLAVREGRAVTRVDLVSGATEINWDARLNLDKGIGAELHGQGRIVGSLADPPARWTVSKGFLKLSPARVKGCLLNGEVTFEEGTLERLPWRGEIGCGDDRARAEGLISWKSGFGLEAQVTLDARDLSPYQEFLPEGLKARASGIHLQGRAELGPSGPLFEGALRIGKGQVSGISWDSVTWGGRLLPHEAVICQLDVQGMPAAPSISLLGTVRASSDYRTLEFDIAGPRIVLEKPVGGALTGLVARGRLDERGVEITALNGQLDHGPFRVAGRWDFRDPRNVVQLHVAGENVLVLSEDKLGRLRVSPDVRIHGNAETGWKVEGSAEVPSLLFYGELSDPQAVRTQKAKQAAAPKLQLSPAPGGGFKIPAGLEGGERVSLDLQLRTTREARIENSSLGALVRADLRLGGTLALPSISGTVGARTGEVKLATGVFLRIERLELKLPREEGHAATIYFKGRSGKGEGSITVVMVGPLDDPTLTLSSNPPRKQEELLAALAFGQAPGTVSGQGALGTLAVKVFEQATDTWPKSEPKEGFWSRLSLSTASEDAPDADKRVPWQLPPTASARGTIVRTEYLLNSFLSVVVESDREANVSGDFKVRFHFR